MVEDVAPIRVRSDCFSPAAALMRSRIKSIKCLASSARPWLGSKRLADLQFRCPFVTRRTGIFCFFPLLFSNSSLGTTTHNLFRRRLRLRWGTDYWSCLGGTRARGLCAQRVCNPLHQVIDTFTLAEDSGVQLRWAHRQKCLCS